MNTSTAVATTTETILSTTPAPQDPRPHVRWTEDTVDNENQGRRKSKICCIFKKKRNFGEDSSDDDCGH
jgi:protein phosphatase 1 regulatory subunit 11